MTCLRRTRRAVFIAIAAILALSACSSSSNGDKKAFCRINADLIGKTANLQSADDAVAAFKKVQPQFPAYLEAAPSEVKPDAQHLVDAANNAVKTNDPSAFASDKTLTQSADRIASFCGQNESSGSSS